MVITGSIASGGDFTPWSEGNQDGAVYGNGRSFFDLDNLWYSAEFKNGVGSVTTDLTHVSYMARSEIKYPETKLSFLHFGSGEGEIMTTDDGDHDSWVVYFPSNGLEATSGAGIPPPYEGYASKKVFTQGEFYYDIDAQNLTEITFKLDGRQSALLSTTGGAEGLTSVTGSFALYDAYDPICPDPLDSDTKSIRIVSRGRELYETKQWEGQFDVSYKFRKPFSGNLLLKGTFLNKSQANTSFQKHSGSHSAGAPEPSLFITMAASLIGLLGMKLRKHTS